MSPPSSACDGLIYLSPPLQLLPTRLLLQTYLSNAPSSSSRNNSSHFCFYFISCLPAWPAKRFRRLWKLHQQFSFLPAAGILSFNDLTISLTWKVLVTSIPSVAPACLQHKKPTTSSSTFCSPLKKNMASVRSSYQRSPVSFCHFKE